MPVEPIRPRRSFIDTNLLLYCDDSSQPEKQKKALELVVEHRKHNTGVVSIQVLQEYYANSVRKYGADPLVARKKVEIYARFEVVEPSVADLMAAIDLNRTQMISYWDAMIVHCAQRSGCRVLLSEDMQHGQTINGVRIVNPFVE